MLDTYQTTGTRDRLRILRIYGDGLPVVLDMREIRIYGEGAEEMFIPRKREEHVICDHPKCAASAAVVERT